MNQRVTLIIFSGIFVLIGLVCDQLAYQVDTKLSNQKKHRDQLTLAVRVEEGSLFRYGHKRDLYAQACFFEQVGKEQLLNAYKRWDSEGIKSVQELERDLLSYSEVAGVRGGIDWFQFEDAVMRLKVTEEITTRPP